MPEGDARNSRSNSKANALSPDGGVILDARQKRAPVDDDESRSQFNDRTKFDVEDLKRTEITDTSEFGRTLRAVFRGRRDLRRHRVFHGVGQSEEPRRLIMQELQPVDHHAEFPVDPTARHHKRTRLASGRTFGAETRVFCIFDSLLRFHISALGGAATASTSDCRSDSLYLMMRRNSRFMNFDGIHVLYLRMRRYR